MSTKAIVTPDVSPAAIQAAEAVDDFMGLLDRAAILGANDLDVEIIDIPEWGGKVRIQELSGTDRDVFEDAIVVQKREGKHVTREVVMKNARALIATLCCVDKNGIKIFTHADVVNLGRKSGRALQRVFEAGMRLSKMTEKDVEEMGNDSGSDQSDGSTSA